MRSPLASRLTRVAVVLAGAPLALSVPSAPAAPPSDSAKPELVPLLRGYDRFWHSNGSNDLHGTVRDRATLRRNDRLVVWVNHHATPAQRFRALQDSEYDDSGDAYDQSVTIADALGSVLGPLYAEGRTTGKLRLTGKLVNSQDGSAGAYVETDDAKAHFSYPRPYLTVDPGAKPLPGAESACAPSRINGSSLRRLRKGRPWADKRGNLRIRRVPGTTDKTRAFAPDPVTLSPGYGTEGLCTGGSFPSGHTTTAYQAGLTLATLLPELAPEIMARASEQANNRLVLGVHYPLDLMGGRIDGEVSLATRWSDAEFRTTVLEPARAELRGYLEAACAGTIAACIARGTPYRDDPYGGRRIPGGTAQVVRDRPSAIAAYRERLTYGFPARGSTRRRPAVPARAQSLLRTTFPTLTAAQRTAVLAQTQIRSGHPLDRSGTRAGSWQRLNLAAAFSATVRVAADGSVRVVRTGGPAQVQTG